MRIENRQVLTIVCIGLITLLDLCRACDLNCGHGYRCVMRRSTCEYPPCPYFPTCVQRRHSHHHNGQHRSHRHSEGTDTSGQTPSILRQILIDDSVSSQSDDVSRPGQCPVPSATGPCIHQCRLDGDCPASKKCCFNGCGNMCRDVLNTAVEKPGSCPRQLLSDSVQCHEQCKADSDCAGVKKCCNTACGSRCSDPCYYWLRSMERSTIKRSLMWNLPFICRTS